MHGRKSLDCHKEVVGRNMDMKGKFVKDSEKKKKKLEGKFLWS